MPGAQIKVERVAGNVLFTLEFNDGGDNKAVITLVEGDSQGCEVSRDWLKTWGGRPGLTRLLQIIADSSFGGESYTNHFGMLAGAFFDLADVMPLEYGMFGCNAEPNNPVMFVEAHFTGQSYVQYSVSKY